MKRVTILKAAAHYDGLLKEAGFKPERLKRNYIGRDKKLWENHAFFIISRVKLLIYSGHRDKAMRWLSCGQGIINALGISCISESKIQLMPKKPQTRK